MSGPAVAPAGLDSSLGAPKKRKRRAQLSCTECRRLKMRCNREAPCDGCIRRRCPDICRRDSGDGDHSPPLKSSKVSNAVPDSGDRVSYLEELLRQNGIALESEASRPSEPLQILAAEAANREPEDHLPSQMLDVINEASNAASTGVPPFRSEQAQTTLAQAALQDHGQSTEHPPQAAMASKSTSESQPADLETLDPVDDYSHGTLVITQSGRTKYLGRTAASEWLKNQEEIDELDGAASPPAQSRFPSPARDPPRAGQVVQGPSTISGVTVAFPFSTAARAMSTAAILAIVPPVSEARVLLEAFFRHFTWHFHVVRRAQVEDIMHAVYTRLSDPKEDHGLHPESLALLFAVLATGTFHNLELPADDPLAEDYLAVARCCLAKSDFLANSTLNGIQALFLMAHLELSIDKDKDGDASWPLWGLCARLTQAMGLHRDGEKWNLPQELNEDRRRVFWEVQTTDVSISNCFSRPCSLNPRWVDTKYPTRNLDLNHSGDAFHQATYELTHVAYSVLDCALQIIPPPYSEVLDIHSRLALFELNLPFEFRCRPAACVLISLYPELEAAQAATPPTNKRDLHLTFRQASLQIKISELAIFLHRPYFARALVTSPKDPTRDIHGQSYLTVVERCNVIVTVSVHLYELYPSAAARHWWIWYHAFNSAACMATLVIRNPHNVLTGFAVGLIDSTICVYSKVVQNRNSPRMNRNLRWLNRLRSSIAVNLANLELDTVSTNDSPVAEREDLVELVGWRTRLIRRVRHGEQTATTIQSASPSGLPLYATSNSPTGSQPIDMANDPFLQSLLDPCVATSGVNNASDTLAAGWWGLTEYSLQ